MRRLPEGNSVSVFDTIRTAVTEHDDDHAAAEAVYDSILKRDMIPLLLDECRRQRRHLSRRAEEEVFSTVRAVPEDAEKFDPVQDRHTLLLTLRDVPLRIGDGTVTTWGEASRDFLESRREMLTKQVAGLKRTIDHLDEVLTFLDETGTDCLNDALQAKEVAA